MHLSTSALYSKHMNSVHFSKEQLERADTIAFEAALGVASTLHENFGKAEHMTKSNERDWVTQWDAWAEERMKEHLGTFSADIGFLGEETGGAKGEVYWAIDGIDGSSAYVRGIDTCTNMYSLVDSGVPVVGGIYDFVRGVGYTAFAGGGAYKNRVQRMQVSDRPMPTAYIESYVPLETEEGALIDAKIREAGAYILHTACAGHMFTSIARGATEGFVSWHNPYATVWDYAPGALLVHEAGGMVVNVDSDTYTVDNPDFIASNRATFTTLKSLVSA
jgi:myo-inositol-1(or 4)-monophosphatase